jgi:hypothetical protein
MQPSWSIQRIPQVTLACGHSVHAVVRPSAARIGASFRLARVPVNGGGGGTSAEATENRLTITVGSRRMYDGELTARQNEMEALQRELDELQQE